MPNLSAVCQLSRDQFAGDLWGYLTPSFHTVLIGEKLVCDYKTPCDHFYDCLEIKRGREYGNIEFSYRGYDGGYPEDMFNGTHISSRIERAFSGYEASLDNPYDCENDEYNAIVEKIVSRTPGASVTYFYIDRYGAIQDTETIGEAEYICFFSGDDFDRMAISYEYGELVYAILDPEESLSAYEPGINSSDFFEAAEAEVGNSVHDWEYLDTLTRWDIRENTFTELLAQHGIEV